MRSQPLATPYLIYYIEDYALYQIAIDGSHHRKLLENNHAQYPYLDLLVVSPNRDSLLLAMRDPNTDNLSIYRRRFSNGKLQILPFPEMSSRCARFSNDGRWIFYEREDYNGASLHRMRVDGSGDQFLSTLSFLGNCNRWDLQGDWVAVLDATESIRYMRLDGTNSLLIPTEKRETYPLLSPNAQWVVSLYSDTQHLILRSLAEQTTYPIPESSWIDYDQYAFSPNSEWLVFQYIDPLDRTYELMSLHLPDLTKYHLAESIYGDLWLPPFLPDADWLIFRAGNEHTTDTYRVNYDGTHLMPLVTEETDDEAVAISPDHKWLIIHSMNADYQTDLYLVSVDGKQKKRLTNSLNQKYDAQFIPIMDLPWHTEILALGAVLCLVGAGWSIGRRLR